MKKILTPLFILLSCIAVAQPPVRIAPGLVTCGESNFFVKLTTDRQHIPQHDVSPVTCPDRSVHYDTEEGDVMDCKMELFADANFTIPVPVDPRFFSFVRDVPGSAGTVDNPNIMYDYNCSAMLPAASDYGDNWRVDHSIIWMEQCIWECVGSGYYNCSSTDFGEPLNYNIMINCCFMPSVLAVRLLSFEGVRSSSGVNTLHWSLADTSDLAQLIVERSFDGVNYTVVYSTGDASISSFSEPLDLNAYYRIKVYSANGSPFYSQVVLLKAMQDLKNSFSVSPSPFNTQLRVSVTSTVTGRAVFRLITADGKTVVASEQLLKKGMNTFNLDIPQVSKGIYLFSMSDESGTVSKKVLKQ